MKKILQYFKSIFKIFNKFLKNQNGGSMIESGLLIALSLILFLMLIAVVSDIYGWIEGKFSDVINFFDLVT